MRRAALAWMFAALGLLLATPAFAADTVYYYSSDTLHSEVVVTDQSRNVVERTHYAPYGQVLDRDLRDGPGYTGHEEDPETNLVYMQQRYYDPEAGRFLSTDPVQADGGGGSFNRYEYAQDNPYRFTDPFGMCTGSNISNKDGTCVSTGGYTTGTNGAAQGLNRALAAAKQVAIGVAKGVLNAVHSAVPHFDDPPLPNGYKPYDENAPQTASNGLQAGGMVAGSILTSVGIAAATDDPAAGEAVDATAPVGRLGSPMDVPRGTNTPGSVGGIEYSGHAFDQMQGRGITPSVVRNTIETGVPSPGRNGATVYYDKVNNTTVITNQSGRVITVYPGGG